MNASRLWTAHRVKYVLITHVFGLFHVHVLMMKTAVKVFALMGIALMTL
jgi:hypothetical protein